MAHHFCITIYGKQTGSEGRKEEKRWLLSLLPDILRLILIMNSLGKRELGLESVIISHLYLYLTLSQD
jgi:hypothetical protein